MVDYNEHVSGGSFAGVCDSEIVLQNATLPNRRKHLIGSSSTQAKALWAFYPEISNLEVSFQQPKYIVRKLVSGDLDVGIVGLDTLKQESIMVQT